MAGTAYNAYLRTDVLHTLQDQVTEDEGERSFLVICQVQELFFSLISHEIECAGAHLRSDRTRSAISALKRAESHFAGLNASWRSLSWMLPADFHSIKIGMTQVHGKSSSLQSWKYREMLFRLGLKQEGLAEELASMPDQYAGLRAAFVAPSVYEEALGSARRQGYDIPEKSTISNPDPARLLEPSVVSFWSEVYLSSEPAKADLFDLAQALIAIAEGLAEYKHLHFLTTSRTLGARTAYFGTSGTSWLLETLHVMPFPELWATRVGAEK